MLHNTALAQKVSLACKKKKEKEQGQRNPKHIQIVVYCVTTCHLLYQTPVGVTTNKIPSEAGAKRDQDEAMKETDLAVSATVITCDLDLYLLTTISCFLQKVVNKQQIWSELPLSSTGCCS